VNNVPNGLVLLIKDIYKNNSVQVKSDGKLSGKIPVKRVVRQGDSLSPTAFQSGYE
jgi:hypothetical protein